MFDPYWPVLTRRTVYACRENADGSVEGGERFATTYAEAPFLRIDRAGGVTATGTITNPGDSDIPEGTVFEFGARAQDQWVERYGE